MSSRFRLLHGEGLLAIGFLVALFVSGARAGTDTLPARLDDKDFWQMALSFSERPGSFGSDNLLSNEEALQDVIPDLVRAVKSQGIYLGVGPEQNFTYIAAIRLGLPDLDRGAAPPVCVWRRRMFEDTPQRPARPARASTAKPRRPG